MVPSWSLSSMKRVYEKPALLLALLAIEDEPAVVEVVCWCPGPFIKTALARQPLSGEATPDGRPLLWKTREQPVRQRSISLCLVVHQLSDANASHSFPDLLETERRRSSYSRSRRRCSWRGIFALEQAIDGVVLGTLERRTAIRAGAGDDVDVRASLSLSADCSALSRVPWLA